jgi:hypothetical protein
MITKFYVEGWNIKTNYISLITKNIFKVKLQEEILSVVEVLCCILSKALWRHIDDIMKTLLIFEIRN